MPPAPGGPGRASAAERRRCPSPAAQAARSRSRARPAARSAAATRIENGILLRALQAVDGSAVMHQVHLALGVGAEGGDVKVGVEEQLVGPAPRLIAPHS